jgi:hypothetical protein
VCTGAIFVAQHSFHRLSWIIRGVEEDLREKSRWVVTSGIFGWVENFDGCAYGESAGLTGSLQFRWDLLCTLKTRRIRVRVMAS